MPITDLECTTSHLAISYEKKHQFKTRPIYIAVIGSRETKAEVLARLREAILTVDRLAKRAVVFTSGGCHLGPDDLITQLSRDNRLRYTRIFIPSLEYGKKSRFYFCQDRLVYPSNEDEQYVHLLKRYHPYYEALLSKKMVFRLHARNMNIILGDDLKSPVDYVLFAADEDKKGRVKGGTGTGVAAAIDHDVECFNFNNPLDINSFNKRIIELKDEALS